MAFKTANPLDVSYDSKAYGNIISPTEWNANFKKIEDVDNGNVSNLNDNFTLLAGTGGSAEIGSPAIESLGESEDSTVYTQLITLATGLASKESSTDLATKLNGLVKGVSYASGTGVFTITFYNDTTIAIDTVIEKVPASLSLVESGNITYLRITNQDGSYTQTDVTNLVNSYTFTDSDTIDFAVDGFSVTAAVKDGSITGDKLDLTYKATLEGYVTSASGSATTAISKAASAASSASDASGYASTAGTKATEASASATSANGSSTAAGNYAKNAQSWAVGGTNSRDGEDTNNALYYMNQARQIVDGDYVTTATFDTKIGDVATLTTAADNVVNAVNEVKTTAESKADSVHTHNKSQITDFPTTMAPTVHTHVKSQITDFPTAMTPTAHTHTKSEITDFPTIPETVNNLITDDATKNLSAAQGKVLSESITAVNAALSGVIRMFRNITVPTSAWVSDITYSTATYKADVTCIGITSDYACHVNFCHADAISGVLDSPSETGTDKVTIWAKTLPTASITIDNIECIKAVS